MAKICSKCGTEYSVAPICVKCGCTLTPNARFFPNCGADQNAALTGASESYLKKGFDTFASTINTMAGETGKVDICR